MRTRVKYIKATDNTEVGTEKLLQPKLARDLERQGYVEIIGEGIASKRATSMVAKVEVEAKVIDLTPSAGEPATTTTDGAIDYTTFSFAELRLECENAGLEIPKNPSKIKLIALLSNR